MTLKKFLDWAITTAVAAILAWGVWATKEIYAQKTNTEVIKESAKAVCQDVKEIREQTQKTDEKREQDKQDIMKELLKIQRQLKK